MSTIETQLASELMILADDAQHHIAGLRKLLDRQVEQLTSNFRNGKERQLKFPFSLDDAASAAKTQAELALWAEVEASAQWLLEKGETAVWLSAIMDQREQSTRALVQNYNSPLSRSTSVIHNIHDDLVMASHREFIYVTDRMNVERLWELAGPDILTRRAARKAKEENR